MLATININVAPSPQVPAAITDPGAGAGFSFLTDENGDYITDENGGRIIVPN